MLRTCFAVLACLLLFFFFCKGCTAVSEFFLGFYFTIRSFFFSCLACCPVSSRKHKEQNEEESWRFTPSLNLEPRTTTTTTQKKNKEALVTISFIPFTRLFLFLSFFFFSHSPLISNVIDRGEVLNNEWNSCSSF